MDTQQKSKWRAVSHKYYEASEYKLEVTKDYSAAVYQKLNRDLTPKRYIYIYNWRGVNVVIKR